jgi:hypothetical protein
MTSPKDISNLPEGYTYIGIGREVPIKLKTKKTKGLIHDNFDWVEADGRFFEENTHCAILN